MGVLLVLDVREHLDRKPQQAARYSVEMTDLRESPSRSSNCSTAVGRRPGGG
ncbi:hypothetical protein ACFCW6_04995 [Streptomyces sp. NPDC056333]|uniref:hypothetical protein n=1 Tax=Streptomyces sp. NPDC056333 TaxID=3345786 RepID=UPI0035DF7564